jgi:hypothetical protein
MNSTGLEQCCIIGLCEYGDEHLGYLKAGKTTVFWDVAPCSLAIAMMMEAASPSETSVNFYQTTRSNIPEDSYVHIRRRENLNFHLKAGNFTTN